MLKSRCSRTNNESTRRSRDGGVSGTRSLGGVGWVIRMDSASPQDNGREERREDNESKGETTEPTSDDDEGTDTVSLA